MENNLDRFFRENLNERQFEFKDEYWLEAEKLLDAAKRRRRRALVFWWLGGAALVVAVVVAGILIVRKNQIAPAITKAENQIVASENLQRKKTGSAVKPGNEAESKVQGFNSSANTSRATSEIIGTEITAVKKDARQNASLQMAAASGAKASLLAVEIAPSNLAETNFSGLEPPLPSQLSEVETAEAEALAFTQRSDLQQLPLLQNGVTGNFSNELKVSGKLKKLPQSPFHIGVAAGQNFQVQPDSGEQTILGWHVGLTLQRNLGKGFFAATGLNYLRRAGNFDGSKSAERVNYRFGREAELQLLRPSSLHYLALPVRLGWQRGHHVVEGGGGLHFLLGLRGEKGKLERVGDEKIFKPSQKGWLVEDGFKKWHFNTTFGYRYRVNRQLSLGVSANYTFGGILQKDYVPPLLNGYVLREVNRVFVSADAVYFIR